MNVYVMNHKSRCPKEIVEDLNDKGFNEVSVFTDETDFYKRRDKYRLAGVQSNYMKIVRDFIKSGEDHALVIQDDIRLKDGAWKQVDNARKNWRSQTIIMFYFFKNRSTLRAKKTGRKYNESNSTGLTMQMTMISRDFAIALMEYYDSQTMNGYYWEETATGEMKVSGEDHFIQDFCRKYKVPMWWHFPVLCEHGTVESSLKNHGGRRDW